jgi:hypothetical protein
MLCVIIYLSARYAKFLKIKAYAGTFLSQGVISIIFFNCFNVAFSGGVHWKYSDSSDPSYVKSSALLILSLMMMVVVIVGIEMTNKKYFGEFKNKFKESWNC